MLPGILRQLSGLGGCTHPIRLDGHRTEYDVDTRTGEIGNVLHRLDSTSLPAGQLLVRCNNRRTTRCAACAEVYRRDTFHLITSGLRGGKGTPEHVATHPRVFATFTAPSFGPVHNRPSSGRPCRCGTHHDHEDEALGSPLDPDTYDYEAAVLWNAHAGPLWRRFSTYLRREVAAVAAYIAKYATKGAETATGALDRPLKFAAELAQLDISDHARRLIRTAWFLGARKDLEHLRLRAWAHMLGFRGHFSTKSRRYSTTLGALRDARAEWRRAQAAAANGPEPDTTYVLAHWVFAGTGLSDAEAWLAASLEPAPGTEGEPTWTVGETS
ncbi:replication initiator [Streptomyces sp. NPDC007991]|uniref:replication initiator n=1 Tax=Streptomyces sp. NPDC007991 TaxID=3364803 RepID=UPI0036E679C1